MSAGLPIKDANGKDVDLFAVEYQHQGGRWAARHSIVTSHDTWDACWSRSYGLLVHASGSGYRLGRHWVYGYVETKAFPGRLWTAPGVKLACYGGDGKPEKTLSEAGLRLKGLKRFAKLPGDPFEDARNVEGHIEWCSICRDWLDDEPDAPCDHLRWSDDACQLIGSGADWSECDVYVKESLLALCMELGRERIEQLRRDIVVGRFAGDLLHDERVEASTAEAWLNTIGTGRGDRTKRARSRTLVILDEWLGLKVAS